MSAAPQSLLRVATYNVHGCVGTDGARSEERIAEVIASLYVDIIGLQELDLNRGRSRRVDQAARIAACLGWHALFHPAVEKESEQYGDAILSRFPLTPRRAGVLPARAPWFCRESRGALWVTAATPGGPCHVLNTHLGLGRRERLTQAALLAGPEWLGALPGEPAILMGDFNCLPGSAALRLLARALPPGAPPPRTPAAFPSRRPLIALDHILVNRYLKITRLSAVRNPLTRIASDHLPLVADISA